MRTCCLARRQTDLISERNAELHRLAAALEDVKQQLDSRGSNLSDASPLVGLKAGMERLRGELKAMEVRIGVASHNLLAASRADKAAAAAAARQLGGGGRGRA